MGGGLMSTLQGIGSTGNEIGAGAIASQQQSHQFLMDYLARQAQTRQLNLEQSGQEQVGKIAAGQQDIQRQQLAQSRWQVMPGYTKIPHPTDPTKTMFRTTLLDPVTGQRVFHDVDQPPVGSPEYTMAGYNYADQFAKKAGITLSLGQKLAFGGMKVDTPEENNQRYGTLYDMIAADPDGLRYLKDTYKGGKGQFIDEHVKAGLGGYSKEDQLKMIRDFVAQGKDATGKPTLNPNDKALLTSYNQSLTAYEKQLSDATKIVKDLGMSGMYLRPEAYASAIGSRDTATRLIDETKTKIADLTTQMQGGAAANVATTPSPAPTHINPIVSHPDTDKAQVKAVSLGLGHIWHDKDGNVIGFSPDATGKGYKSIESLNQ